MDIKKVSARPVVTENGNQLLEMTIEGSRPIKLGAKKIAIVLNFKDECEKFLKGELGEPTPITFGKKEKRQAVSFI